MLSKIHAVAAKSAVGVFRAMLGLFKHMRAGQTPSAHAKGKVVIIEHPATDYKPSNPK
jgi:hypothetical protein